MRAILYTARHLQRNNRNNDLPSLWLMTDAVRLPNPMAAVLRLPRGSGVIVRHTDAAQRRALAEVLIRVCRMRGLTCLIAGDWRLAARLGADGVHLPEAMARGGVAAAAHLWLRRGNRVLTVSAHNLAVLIRGARMGADAILLAPVFPTASHPERQGLGVTRFAALARRVACPVIALGGINERTAPRLTPSRASGIAGIGWAEIGSRT